MSEKEIASKIQQAIEIVEREITPPLPILTIDKGSSHTYTIKEVEESGKEYLIVTCDNVVHIKEPKSSFRIVLFSACSDCRVFSLVKLLKLSFIYCDGMNISVRGGLIGPAELFRCKDCVVDVRSHIPVVHAGLCSTLHFYQRIDENVYVIGSCSDVEGVLVSVEGKRESKYNLESLFDNQTYILLSRRSGVVRVQEPYALNNIEQHLIFLDPDDLDVSLNDYIKWGTPT